MASADLPPCTFLSTILDLPERSWRAGRESFRRIVEMLQYALLDYGHFAVGVFIVLSGYCLMLPVARSTDGR